MHTDCPFLQNYLTEFYSGVIWAMVVSTSPFLERLAELSPGDAHIIGWFSTSQDYALVVFSN